MKVFDCFLFFDEEVQLDIRLNSLNQYVDKFVIVESKFSHSGEKREPIFDINKYKKFKDKINYILLEKEPEGIINIRSNENPKEDYKKVINGNIREFFQRNAIFEGISEASDEDFIIISDVDEIPNLEDINFSQIKNKFVFFKQIFFCYKLNLFSESLTWYGSRMIRKRNLISPQWLRDIKDRNYPLWRIDTLFSKKKYSDIFLKQNGGWHFSYIKDAKGVEKKLKSIRHYVEYDLNPIGVNRIEKMIKEKKLIYNYNVDQTKNKFLNTETLKEISLDKLPKYVYLNKNRFKDWIYTNN